MKRKFYNIENIKEKLLLVHGSNYELLSQEYYHKTRLEILHKDCKKVWKVLISNVFKRNCPHCSFRLKSSLSSRIENFLSLNKINYKLEYTFKDCKNINPLPFDFAVFDGDKLVFLIEADGEQHYKDTGFSRGGLKEVQKRDFIKSDYCISNGISLIRIPYFKETEVESILEPLVKNIILKLKSEPKVYYTKSNISEGVATLIRENYILESNNIKRLSKSMGISEGAITKIIKYITHPFTDSLIKEEVLRKYKNLKPKSINILKISDSVKNKIIEEKQKCTSDTKIGLMFNVNRKSLPLIFPSWSNLCNKEKL